MQCPVCKSDRSVQVKLEDQLSATSCKDCGGQWIAYQDYTRWLEQHGETLPEKAFSEVAFDVQDVKKAKLCPQCGRIMLKYKVGHGLDFYLDYCTECGGIWLDKNEWDALEGKNLHDEIFMIFTTEWQKQIREEGIAEKLDAIYADRFGDEYDKIKALRDWLQQHPEKQTVLAFLTDKDPYRAGGRSEGA